MTQHPPPNPAENPTAHIVDDDDAMRRAIGFLLDTAGIASQSFSSAEAFFAACQPETRGCLLLDVRMPGLSGVEALERLKREEVHLPVILVTAYADVPLAVRAMRAGAYDIVEKPFDDEELLSRVREALANEREEHYLQERVRTIRQRLDRLTPREREVLGLILDGMINKQIADALGISVKTVEEHRARISDKMEARGLADLVRMSTLAGLD